VGVEFAARLDLVGAGVVWPAHGDGDGHGAILRRAQKDDGPASRAIAYRVLGRLRTFD
jgi:hypothetical protein